MRIGLIVNYVMPESAGGTPVIRPAIIVNIYDKDDTMQKVQLQVFTDGSNDGKQYEKGLYWATSVPHSDDHKPGTWHHAS